jgi:cytochrome c-type biogenesis protein CcsB
MEFMQKVFAFLASLKLAVILLALLLVGLSVGTIIETRAGVEAAGNLVYYSYWFLGLQGLFAVNLAMSLADLFPWTRRRTGFVVVHASLLLIFAGAAMTYFLKVEGTLGLWEGQSGSVIENVDREGHVLSRHQLPFTVKLDDFVLETYPGTMRPSGFSSQVQVTDHRTGATFPARIWMNHELTYRGYALFQSSYQQANGREATVLAVSRDPGQNIVFAGYLTLILGMVIVLGTRMAQSRQRSRAAGTALLVLLMAGGLSAAEPVDSIRRLPVQHDGRTMPFDTFAREAVWLVTGSHSWKGEDPAETVSGWLSNPPACAEAPVVKIGSSKLALSVGLPANLTHASFFQLVQNAKMMDLVRAAREAEAENAPRQGLVAEAEKLDGRLQALQALLQQQAVRPIPALETPSARWNPPVSLAPEELVRLARGPRLQGWPSADKIDQEVFYNRLNPERLSWIILLASLALSIGAGLRKSRLLDWTAFATLAGGFAMMSWGILLRWGAGERIPAANMYESMLFLAWGVGFFALVAFAVLRNRMVVLNAAAMAALTMMLADLLPIDRFIHPIAPVLAGTPWLAIHVPIIMVGYSVLALGLMVAHMQVGATIFAPRRADLLDRMYELLYWYMFVGSIFLIAGIITGSMWAASSWGRYWGWDPKEVWSLVAFLAYMAILHAKVDRLIGRFGVAVISIAAFQTILMTYLGVNFVLSTGMHSYGMGDSPVVKWMVMVGLVEALFLAWGVVAYRKHHALLRAGDA